MDLAASIQSVTEEVVLRMTRALASETKMQNLCLAGGVALNCVANGKVLRDGSFDHIWIQPAAGDAGGALGAALAAYFDMSEMPRKISPGIDAMRGSYLGPEYAQSDVEQRLSNLGANYQVLNEKDLFISVVKALTSDQAVGWFQGKMEFGPRALGGRSILGDPRSPDMQKSLNLKVKYRESFRPFAPSIQDSAVSEWFELNHPSPYMLLVADIASNHKRNFVDDENVFGIDKLKIIRSDIPAVTHVDNSARIQTVHRETNSKFYDLISEFNSATGCPILVNTSFNVRGEPIVCTPEDAFRCFMGTEMEALAIGNCFLKKSEQDPNLQVDYKNMFELD